MIPDDLNLSPYCDFFVSRAYLLVQHIMREVFSFLSSLYIHSVSLLIASQLLFIEILPHLIRHTHRHSQRKSLCSVLLIQIEMISRRFGFPPRCIFTQDCTSRSCYFSS
ncbi:unnamed protein product, partial [Amoebophrya sp. A25]|eukprot:GSA25T00027662001.1